jgi:hypothetical protein
LHTATELEKRSPRSVGPQWHDGASGEDGCAPSWARSDEPQVEELRCGMAAGMRLRLMTNRSRAPHVHNPIKTGRGQSGWRWVAGIMVHDRCRHASRRRVGSGERRDFANVGTPCSPLAAACSTSITAVASPPQSVHRTRPSHQPIQSQPTRQVWLATRSTAQHSAACTGAGTAPTPHSARSSCKLHC